jgi:membrane-associated phospholipid phosphatase
VWLAAGLAAVFLALTVLVVTGAADPLDERITHYFRPTVAWWGDTQKRYSPWMTWLEPAHMFALLAVTCLVVAARRRSWWTVFFAVVPAGCGVAAAAAMKLTIARPDPHGGVSASGGAYPSGHMVAVVVCVAVCLLVLSPRVRWWWWAALAVPSWLMATSLVVTAAHWPSDVLGGALLAGAVVAGASGLTWRGRAHRVA